MKLINKTPSQLQIDDVILIFGKRKTIDSVVLNPHTGEYVITYSYDKFGSHVLFCRADDQLTVEE